MAGHGGGAWKVAYADFVTAMMAFFMVMWLTSQKAEVKKAVAGYFRDPFATFKGADAGAGADAGTPQDAPKQKDQASDTHVRSAAPSGRDIDSRFTILFAEDGADLSETARRTIGVSAPDIIGKLNRVEIRAHCVRKPLQPGGKFSDRWQLCFERCRVIMEELEKLGIEPERIRLSQAEGNEPISTNLATEELELNSRVDVIMLPDYADIPWRENSAGVSSQSTDKKPSG